MSISEKTLTAAIVAALKANEAISDVYNQNFAVRYKSDGSPVTEADMQADKIILKHLKSTNIPVLSEERQIPPYAERKNYDYVWMVDPLDGTKEFTRKNGEFTVNIALIHQQEPVFGIITAPALNVGYLGRKNHGAYKIRDINDWNKTPVAINYKNFLKESTPIPGGNAAPESTVAISRSHFNPSDNELIRQLLNHKGEPSYISRGSSLKFCLLAEGKARFYIRTDKIHEWDTAAGHAILLAAGGAITTWPDKGRFIYNKESLQNPGFVACTNPGELELLKTKFSF